ncbi:MAG: hypothetical protein ACLR23_21585 [Clostridia bacterium]
MHAGEAGNSRGQRANGGKIPAGRFETSKPEEKREEKCTPAKGGQQRPACKRRQNPRRQIRDAQAGGEMGRKMHAGEARKGRGQRAHRGKIHAGGQSSNICRGRSFFRQPPVFPIERLPNPKNRTSLGLACRVS